MRALLKVLFDETIIRITNLLFQCVFSKLLLTLLYQWPSLTSCIRVASGCKQASIGEVLHCGTKILMYINVYMDTRQMITLNRSSSLICASPPRRASFSSLCAIEERYPDESKPKQR